MKRLKYSITHAIAKVENKWHVYEKSSGGFCGSGKTQKLAIKQATTNIKISMKEAYHAALRYGDITPEQLDKALGSGPKLTALLQAAPHNPHKNVVIVTPYDGL